MSNIFGLSFLASLLSFSCLGLFILLVGKVSLRYFAKRMEGDEKAVPIGAFAGTIATAWALSLGFAAADIWTMNAKADQATSDERSSISRIQGLSNPDILDSGALAELMAAYTKAVVDDEWGAGQNTEPSHNVEIVLHSLRREIVQLASSGIPSPIIAKMVNDFDELQDARNARLAVGATSVDMYKWYLMLFLTILTTVTIAATHGDRKKAGRIAIRIYVVTATFSLWIIAIHASPYQGVDRIEPSSLIGKF